MVAGPQEPDRIALIVLYFVIFTIGFVGNSLVCFIILTKRVAITTTTIFLCNLAFIDLILLLSLVPMKVARQFTLGYILGTALCKIEGYLGTVCLANASLTLVVMGVDKYIAIAKPFKRHYFRKRWAIAIVCIIWILTSLVMMVPLINNAVEYFYYQPAATCIGFCYSYWNSLVAARIYYVFVLSFDFICPSLMIIYFYSTIAIYVIKTKRMHRYGLVKKFYSRRKRQILKMLIAVVAAFYVCWTPYSILTLLRVFRTININTVPYLRQLSNYFLLLTFCSAAINPIIYGLYHENFKASMKLMYSASTRTHSYTISRTRTISRTSTAGSFNARNAERQKSIMRHKLAVLRANSNQQSEVAKV
ncbi:uncharacterized protein TRIADDRAFT_18299 [Trichoplax adhaerens]|uniref:G-protein coupled receptors family 1 profile domain-containing protein n=1 Tax=Trichoplax adhaerens TaxID=10228 RepID=B3RK87_TRIAD|nr:hypothetical protein TRIADDRAFT_18299 [Trichoplax adhaerens]EDV29158.1 hypothetical protein TRIADDRAFT_18299 [Trichoplax adhaerens]|eukprot:XP_002108360.1 hypothetical protein TRIADDRAFT_18299 [Trichoplax adhaerens]